MKNKIFIILTIMWIMLIFYMSHQPSLVSSTQSNKVIHTIREITKNKEIKNKINSFVVRKGAHILLFFILGILLFESIYSGDNLLKSIFLALFLSFLYACSDEYHQTFIVGRSEEFKDVLIDFSGSFIGVLAFSLIKKLKLLLKYDR